MLRYTQRIWFASLVGVWVPLVAYASSVSVDFSAPQDPPLLKKIDMYNAGCIQPADDNYNRDLDKIQELNSQSLRIDLSIGKPLFAGNTVGGNMNALTYDFTPLDSLARRLQRRNVLPYYSWDYVPYPMQAPGGNETNLNTVAGWQNIWQSIYTAYSKNYADKNIPVGYHEVYNEPDLFGVFLSNANFSNNYDDIYKYGALGIKAGNPDAVVGGPAFAIPDGTKVGNFLDFVRSNNLPLDFFSFHTYMDGSWPSDFTTVDNALSVDARFATTEIHVNEFNWLNGGNGANDGSNSIMNFYQGAPKTMDAMDQALQYNDITYVHWAQFMESTFGDDPYGLIRKDGHRKASFNAVKIFADLPTERAQTSVNGSLGSWAGYENHRAAVAIWDRSGSDQSVTISLNHLPFTSGSFRLYRIDKTHASYFDGAPENLAVDVTQSINTNNASWTGTLPANGILYAVAADAHARADFMEYLDTNTVGKEIRVWRYYPKRGTTAYADFDRKTSSAYLGMGQETNYAATAGQEISNAPDYLNVALRSSGNPHSLDNNSLMGFRIDYHTAAGYSKSALFTESLFNTGHNSIIPWGTMRQQDVQVPVSLRGFNLALATYAPAGWDKRVIFSFVLEDAGPGARAVGTFSKGSAPTSSSSVSSSSVAASSSSTVALTVPGHIEAESYSAMFGISAESTTDVGGGQDMGWIDSGDWAEYAVKVNATGNYQLIFRVASPACTACSIQISQGTTVVGSVPVPMTGDWQNWTSVTTTSAVKLTGGLSTLRLTFIGNAFNVNFFDVATATSSSSGGSSSSQGTTARLENSLVVGNPATDLHYRLNGQRFVSNNPQGVYYDHLPDGQMIMRVQVH